MYVSVSKIDQFRLVRETDWASQAALLQEIKAPIPLGWQAHHGEALHACIEDPAAHRKPDGSYAFTSRDGVTSTWPAEIVGPCATAWPRPCIFERRAEQDYRVDGETLTVAGRLDAAWGVVIVEGKTKFGYFDPLDYEASLQWRFYLDMNPWARCVEYRVHEIGGMYSDRVTGELRIARGGAQLEAIHVFRLWRQDDNAEVVRRWVHDFVLWAKRHQLQPHLKRWEERKAA